MVGGAEAIAERARLRAPPLPRALRPLRAGHAGRGRAAAGWTCVHWSALGDDWEDDATGRSVADRILPDLGPGAIVLLHDARRTKPMNPEPVTGATALLLDELARRGLHARSVSDILR